MYDTQKELEYLETIGSNLPPKLAIYTRQQMLSMYLANMPLRVKWGGIDWEEVEDYINSELNVV